MFIVPYFNQQFFSILIILLIDVLFDRPLVFRVSKSRKSWSGMCGCDRLFFLGIYFRFTNYMTVHLEELSRVLFSVSIEYTQSPHVCFIYFHFIIIIEIIGLL